MSRRLTNAALIAMILPNVAGAGTWCIDRVIVRPTGVITTEDPVALEIHIRTPTSPTHLTQPTEVVVNGSQILVDIYADGGPIDMPGFLLETVEFVALSAGTYEYQVVQQVTEDCNLHKVSGNFCVEDVGCAHESCRCPVPPGPTYTIIDLGTLGGGSSVALDINESGQVVGSADTPQGLRHAYLWEAGVMTDLGTVPPDPQSEAWGISNVGHVVGLSQLVSWTWRGFLWQDGNMIDLGNLGALDTAAYDVNDAGQVVGRSSIAPSGQHAFLWEGGVMTDLGTLGDGSSMAYGINELGQVVGSTSLPDGEQGGAFLWEDGVMMNLGSLGGPGSYATDINDHMQVVGASKRLDDGPRHAFFWQDGQMIDLSVVGGLPTSMTEAINNRGEVVGWWETPAAFYPWIYDPKKGMRDLRDLLPIDSGWFHLVPRGINDNGQIIGYGAHGPWRGFLMTPIDADFDDDGDTDMADFATFQTCFRGTGAPIDPGCEARDLDRDGDIDLDDFRALGWVFTGPQD